VPNKYPSSMPNSCKMCLEMVDFFSSKNSSQALFSMGHLLDSS